MNIIRNIPECVMCPSVHARNVIVFPVRFDENIYGYVLSIELCFAILSLAERNFVLIRFFEVKKKEFRHAAQSRRRFAWIIEWRVRKTNVDWLNEKWMAKSKIRINHSFWFKMDDK